MKNIRMIDAIALKEKINAFYDALFVGCVSSDLITFAKGVDIFIDNALTIEPFEPDYVGAERLKARQRGYEDGYHNGMEIGKTLNPKIKQGEWIIIDDTEKFIAKCSICGRIEDSRMVKDYPFCHCGAEMRGDENNGK